MSIEHILGIVVMIYLIIMLLTAKGLMGFIIKIIFITTSYKWFMEYYQQGEYIKAICKGSIILIPFIPKIFVLFTKLISIIFTRKAETR